MSKPSLQWNQSSTSAVETKPAVKPVIDPGRSEPSLHRIQSSTKSSTKTLKVFSESSHLPRRSSSSEVSKPSLQLNHSSTKTVETESLVNPVIDQYGRNQVFSKNTHRPGRSKSGFQSSTRSVETESSVNPVIDQYGRNQVFSESSHRPRRSNLSLQ